MHPYKKMKTYLPALVAILLLVATSSCSKEEDTPAPAVACYVSKVSMEDEQQTSYTNYTYDDKLRLVLSGSQIKFAVGGRDTITQALFLKYVYDKRGSITETQLSVAEEGPFSPYQKFFHDAKGNVVRYEVFYSGNNPEKVQEYCDFTYNAGSQLLTERYYNNGLDFTVITRHRNYHYTDGQMTRMEYLDGNEKKFAEDRFTYSSYANPYIGGIGENKTRTGTGASSNYLIASSTRYDENGNPQKQGSYDNHFTISPDGKVEEVVSVYQDGKRSVRRFTYTCN